MDPLPPGELNRPKRVNSWAVPEKISRQLHGTGKGQDLILGELSEILFLNPGGTKLKNRSIFSGKPGKLFPSAIAPSAF